MNEAITNREQYRDYYEYSDAIQEEINEHRDAIRQALQGRMTKKAAQDIQDRMERLGVLYYEMGRVNLRVEDYAEHNA